MRATRSLPALVLLALIGRQVAAQTLEFTLNPDNASGQQGSRVTYYATVKNSGSTRLYLNQIGVLVTGTRDITGSPGEFYSYFAGALEPGAVVFDKPLFSLQIGPNTPPAVFAGTATLLGGADENALGNLAQRDFRIRVQAIPPPTTRIVDGPRQDSTVCARDVTFTFTGSDSKTPTDRLRYRWRVDGGLWNGPITGTTARLTGLNETAHHFEVAAVNEVGKEDPSPAARDFLVDLRPLTQTEVAALEVTSNTAAIRWITNRPTNSAVEYRRTAGGDWTRVPETRLRVTEHLVRLADLTPTTDYRYRVRSQDDCGAEVLSAELSFTTLKFNPLIATPDRVAISLLTGAPVDGNLDLTNLSADLLPGLKASVENAPANLKVEITVPGQLGKFEKARAQVRITAMDETIKRAEPVIRFTTTNGDLAVAALDVTIVPRRPQLVLQPGLPEISMVRGRQTFVECKIANTGSAAARDIKISLPSVDWMHLVTPPELPVLNPGETARVTLSLSPASGLRLGRYTGTLTANGINAFLTIPYGFLCTSDKKGVLKLLTEDEFTYFVDPNLRVPGAQISVKDVTTGQVVAEGVADAQGFFTRQGIPEGYYNVEVSAPKHAAYRSIVTIEAEQTKELKTFMPRELVTYRWSVVPVDTLDRYVVELETVFETHVPAPVVTVTPGYVDLRKIRFDAQGKAVINYTITNHGLIAANGLKFNFDSHPEYRATPQIEELGTLAARSSVVIPVTIQKLPGGQAGNPCTFSGKAVFYVVCGDKRWTVILTYFSTGDCPPGIPAGDPPPGGGGDRPSNSPPPEYNSPDLCDPCSLKQLKAVLNCFFDICFPNCKEVFDDIKDCLEKAKKAYESKQIDVKAYYDAIKACWKLKSAPYTKCGAELAAEETICPGLAINLGNLKKIWKCVKDVCEACDDMGGGGGKGLGNQYTKYLCEQRKRLEDLGKPWNWLFGMSGVGGAAEAPFSNWFDCSPKDNKLFYKWVDQFWQFASDGTEEGIKISARERQILQNLPRPAAVTLADVNNMLDRWNRTWDYFGRGIFTLKDVPRGSSPDFLAMDVMVDSFAIAASAERANLSEGFHGLFEGPYYAMKALKSYLLAPKEDGICAKVKVRLEQNVTLTRTAFKATLDIANAAQNVRLQNVKVTLEIRDEKGKLSNDLFSIPPPTLTGIGAIDGSGILNPGASAQAAWSILPTRDAAPKEPVTYYFGGTLSYKEGDRLVSMPLFPTPIIVKPDPLLTLNYFWQRDVYGTDPWEYDIPRPSEPFSLGLLVSNRGYGTARTMKITSAQPQIVENEKGLLIDFKLIGSQVNSEEIRPSLEVNLGDIYPGQTAAARWLMTSTLAGKFIDYSARFDHVDGLGNPRVSLIDSVKIHPLDHIVRVVDPADDGKPDFLAMDLPNIENLPDRIYSSDGSDSPVAALTNGQVDAPVDDSHLQVRLTLPNPPRGFVYLRLNDPSQGRYKLLRAVRSDGREIRMGDNAWDTHRTIRLAGRAPYREHRLHLFDRDTTGSYTLVFGKQDAFPLPLGRSKALSDNQTVQLPAVAVTAVFPDGIYVEATDRSSGIRVSTTKVLDEGAQVTVEGSLRTDTNGEKYVQATGVTVTGAYPLDPVSTTVRSLYCGDFYFDAAAGSGQRGMAGGAGLNMVGLYVRALGRVRTIETASFLLDDGFGRSVRTLLPADGQMPDLDSIVAVTGILTTEKTAGELYPVLRPRRKEDIQYDAGTILQLDYASPDGLLNPGFNQFALPGLPDDPYPPRLLANFDPGDGSGLDARLVRWNATDQREIRWSMADGGALFGTLQLGDGYQLTVRDGETPTIGFSGYRADLADRWLSLPKTGLTLLGYPFDFPLNWFDVQVTDGFKTVSITEAARKENPAWINSVATFYDSTRRETLRVGLIDDNPDTVVLLPWYGYFVTSKRDDLALLLPARRSRPSITTIDPATKPAGSPGFTLTVEGKNFGAGSRVRWNNQDRPTTIVSEERLTAAVPDTDLLSPGIARVTVFSPVTGGGTSNFVSFTISDPNNPTPVIAGIVPDTATAGDPSLLLTVNGRGFVFGSVVRWNGEDRETAFVSETQVNALIPAPDLATPGSAMVSVFNPPPGGGESDFAEFVINVADNPVPALTGLSPRAVVTGSPDFRLTVTGVNFVPGAAVRWNGQERETTFISSGELSAAIPASDVRTTGSAAVTVLNPAPGGGVSNALTLTITDGNPIPKITALDPPGSPVGGGALTLTVTGTGYVRDSVVYWNGSPRPTFSISDTQLAAAIPASDLGEPGSVSVTVFNPLPGGGASAPVPFVVGEPEIAVSAADVARSAGEITVSVTLRNQGVVEALSVRLSAASLGGKATTTTPLPDIGTLAPGKETRFTLKFPVDAGQTGDTVTLHISGMFTGGGFQISRRVTLP